MKIDINQLTQDKKKLGIIAGLLVGLVCIGGVVFFLRGSGGGDSAALGPKAAGRIPGGAATSDTGAGAPSNGPGGPGAPTTPPPGPGGPAGSPAMNGEGGPAAAPKSVGAGLAPSENLGDGTQIMPGPPVEPFRADPFRPTARPKAPAPRPVYPPVVAVLEPPTPLQIANQVNIVPSGAAGGGGVITTEPPRRVSGILWGGMVVAVLESPSDPNGKRSFIVRPGDSIPGQNVKVKSITRDRMILVPEDPASGDREIVVDLKPSPRPMGMAPGMMGEPGGYPGSGSGAPMGP